MGAYVGRLQEQDRIAWARHRGLESFHECESRAKKCDKSDELRVGLSEQFARLSGAGVGTKVLPDCLVAGTKLRQP